MSVKPVPPGYHTVTPYLIVDSAAAAIDFYSKAFGAEELFRFEHEGTIGHAEMRIGTSTIMLADAMPEMGYRSPSAYQGSPVSLMMYVEDSDEVFNRAVKLGAEVVRELRDEFYGDRSGNIKDPFGHVWTISTHKEDVAADEMQRRFANLMSAPQG
ncbi:MAG TPA: VOC family protein [Gemmatimonadaceae bacterium]|nr:VOC family protein [Gemmatimonadaceae bacterium]